MSFANPDDAALGGLLDRIKTIAVVGLSPQPTRPSFRVAQAMKRYGYRIIPVRPLVDEVLGEKAYASLADIPFPIDLVDVFRRAEEIDAVVDSAIALKLPAIWIQLGIINEAAALRAQAAGIVVVMDKCLKIEWMRLCA